jgi:cell wall-associated NlpC family hydrolase
VADPGATPGVRLTRVRRLAGLAVVFTLAPTAAVTSPAQAAPIGSQLGSGAELLPGSSIESPGGAYQLTMQPTGNLAETGPAGQLWATSTNSPGSYLVNQPGGDLVLVTTAGTQIWASGTNGQGPANLVITADGDVIDYRGSVPIWSTATATGTATGTGVPNPIPTPAPIPVPAPAPRPSPSPTPTPSRAAATAIAFARKQIGKPYRYGGAGPASYDCSGLVEAAYLAAGVSIPRTSQQQYKQGQVIAASARQPGDLVFYNSSTAPTHVAMYLGNNQIIESLKPGTDIRIDAVTYPGPPVGYRRYGGPVSSQSGEPAPGRTSTLVKTTKGSRR